MKNTIIDIKELSDSKEVYGQRPNPFLSVFVYCLVALLATAILYSCFGKIDIVATASGIVRPNDDVSTVTSLLSGRVVKADYSEGQLVETGDVLLSIDTADKEISLRALEKEREDAEFRKTMADKFLQGIESGTNPFSADSTGEEYPYYIQYRDYELSLKDSKETFAYDVDKTTANMQLLSQQIEELENRLAGLNDYKSSIQEGQNLASAHPEYETLYRLYAATLDAMETEYKTQREKLSIDETEDANEYYVEQYESLVREYGYLVDSIQKGHSVFPAKDKSVCKLLYDEYRASLNEYELAAEGAEKAYRYYEDSSEDDLLSYDYTMLEGYRLYERSVESGEDCFESDRASAYYRSLYLEYRKKYDELMLSDEAQAESFRQKTLADVNNTILQLSTSIAEKELSLGISSSGYTRENARSQMERADATVETYKAKMLAQYQQTLDNYRDKLSELEFTLSSTQDKKSLLDALDTSYQNGKEQKYLQTMSQIDDSIQSAKAELLSAQSNLKLYQITDSLYKNSVDKSGTPLAVSLSSVQQVSSVLSQRETLAERLDELDTQLRQLEEQISQGTIKAERSGIVSVHSVLVSGDAISAGTPIATIIPPSESEYKVHLYVSNADIANVEVGDPVRYNLAALPSNQYGVIEGVVTKISSDTLVQDGGYSGLYLVEASIAGQRLTDKDGNEGSVSIGMQLDAKIVTQEKTILRYLLEKINLF